MTTKKLEIFILANNDELIQRGLMFTKSLPEDKCAFFEFPNEYCCSFWNKNVPYDIDVGFFDCKGKLHQISCLKAHQLQPIKATLKTKFVIEVNKSWFRHNKIALGTNLWDLINLRKLSKNA